MYVKDIAAEPRTVATIDHPDAPGMFSDSVCFADCFLPEPVAQSQPGFSDHRSPQRFSLR
jgi:hypothetical protein